MRDVAPNKPSEPGVRTYFTTPDVTSGIDLSRLCILCDRCHIQNRQNRRIYCNQAWLLNRSVPSRPCGGADVTSRNLYPQDHVSKAIRMMMGIGMPRKNSSKEPMVVSGEVLLQWMAGQARSRCRPP